MRTLEQVYAEIAKRGWEFSWGAGMIAVGRPADNGMLEVLAIDNDPDRALEKAIKADALVKR